jgi:aspartyl-tRNA(Asn)/glutamyl-tRNA(Gln) amidotransferase subunit A
MSASVAGLATLTIPEVQKGLAKGDFSAVELARSALEFAEKENPKTNAYLHFSPERALATAEKVDRKLAAGEDPGALAGVPLAVKDVNITFHPTMPRRSSGWSRPAESF